MKSHLRRPGLHALRCLLPALLLALLTACSGLGPMRHPGVEITDTGLEVGRSDGYFSAAWKDERTLVFSEVIDPSFYLKYGANNFPRENFQIVFYDVVSKKKEVYRPGFLSCFRNGRIAYYQRIADPSKVGAFKEVLYAGELGREELVQETSERRMNPFDCGLRDVAPGRAYGYLMKYLAQEDGYIDGGKAVPGELQYHAPAVWHRPGREPVTLPFMAAHIGSVTWSDFWGGYVMDYASVGPGPRGMEDPPPTKRLLKPNGELTEFPRWPNLRQKTGLSAYYLPTKTVTLAFVRRTCGDSAKQCATSGLYVDDGQTVTHIQNGWVLAGSGLLSPDGCRFPYGSRKSVYYDAPATLKILNVCANEAKRSDRQTGTAEQPRAAGNRD